MPSVKYSGPLSEVSGYSNANRNIIQSLHDAGVDVVTEMQQYADYKTNYGKKHDLALSLLNKHSNYDIKVLHIIPSVYPKFKEIGKYNIGHLFWETDGMSKKWAWFLNEVREIWTGCEWNVKCFRDAGFEGKIFKFPQPIDVERVEEPLTIKNAKGFVFYSIFQWIERKDPKTLLEAYWREFEGDDNVTLLIKTYGLNFSDQQRDRIYEDIASWKKEFGLRKYPRTLIVDRLLSDKQVHRLHASGDCFVLPHHGEGWLLPGVEALVHGKPVISTGLGGMHEWIPDEGMYKVKYKDIYLGKSGVGDKQNSNSWSQRNMKIAEQYTYDQKWGQASLSDLRKKMRQVYSNQEEAKKTALIGQKYVRDHFNFKAVGKLMSQRLNEINKEQGF